MASVRSGADPGNLSLFSEDCSHPARVLSKQCFRCKAWKAASDFNASKDRGGKRLHAYCRECQKGYNRREYSERPERREAIRRRRDEHRLLARAYLDSFLKGHHCVDCGENDAAILEFDHVRGVKRDNVTNMARQALSLQTLRDEVAKCEVRCANCHRRVTKQRLAAMKAL